MKFINIAVVLAVGALAMPTAEVPGVEARDLNVEAREAEFEDATELDVRASKGATIVSYAEKEKGLPYVWGGGGCKGPSKGGFDCSGLTQFAICKALKKTIPRTAQLQYNSKLGKKIKRSEAQEGDLLFWATNGNCNSEVVHTGIFIKKGLMINAADLHTKVREQAIWTSSGGEEICPYVVRFW